MYNKYYVNTQSDIDGIYDALAEIGFDNDVDGDATHYYWRADTPKKFYMSVESQGGTYVEFFLNIKNGETIEKFQIQPFTLDTRGGSGLTQQQVIISTIPLYGGGLVFGMRSNREYQTDYSGDFIDMGTPCPPAKWFTIIPPEDRRTDEWIYIVFDQAFKYNRDYSEFRAMSYDIMYGSTTGEISPTYATIPSREALNCTALTNIYITENNVNKVFKNLWTYGLDNGDSYSHRIFTVRNKKYILLNDCNYNKSHNNYSILCRYT